jgi:NAD(P)H-flavin reductase
MAIAQKLCCTVQRIVDHGEHVYTIDLVSDKLFAVFKPSQFLHLALDTYDSAGFWPDSRVFSIASPTHQRDRLSITYSVRGRFTARTEKELAEGKKVWIKKQSG